MIERAIYSLLTDDAAVTAIVSSRIYIDVKDDKAKGPYVVITKVGGARPLYLNDSPRQLQARFQIDAFAKNVESAIDLAEAVVDLFHGRSAITDDHHIQHGELLGEPRSDFESGSSGSGGSTLLRRRMMEFIFYYH